jgi:hypothetical protein
VGLPDGREWLNLRRIGLQTAQIVVIVRYEQHVRFLKTARQDLKGKTMNQKCHRCSGQATYLLLHDPADASWVGPLCDSCSKTRLKTLADTDLIPFGVALKETSPIDTYKPRSPRIKKGQNHETTLPHYTLATGHTRQSPRSEVSDAVVEQLRPMLLTGRHSLPFAGYECQTTIEGDGLVATVWNDNRPIVTFGVAPNDATASLVWEWLETLYMDTPFRRRVPRRPATTPWCAAIVMAMLPDESWVADFERCLAWTWIETVNRVEH